MLLRQDGLRVSSDFVRHFASASESSIAAHDHKIDFPALKQVTSRIIRDHVVRNSLLGQFPSRERRALAPWPSFIAKHMKTFAGSLRRVHWRCSRPHIHKSQ